MHITTTTTTTTTTTITTTKTKNYHTTSLHTLHSYKLAIEHIYYTLDGQRWVGPVEDTKWS